MQGEPAAKRAAVATFFKLEGICLRLRLTEQEIKNPELAVGPIVEAANAAYPLYELLVDVLDAGRKAPDAPPTAAVGARVAEAREQYAKRKKKKGGGGRRGGGRRGEGWRGRQEAPRRRGGGRRQRDRRHQPVARRSRSRTGGRQ